MTQQWFDALLGAMLDREPDAPDFLFVAGKQPIAQCHGALKEFEIADRKEGLSEHEIERIANVLIDGNKRLVDDYATRGSCDCSYALPGRARFRANIFKQRGRHAIVMRRLPADIPTIDSLGLPTVFHEIVLEKNGIIFVTGATGSGKTSTLAAMLNELNHTQQLHVVTLEDPIEYVHPHKGCIFSQRELGKDFPNFAEGLRAALRQAPKVILVGEIRDRETMEIALTASETGHVVFATLHTIDAGQTVHRIVGMFSKEEEQQVRQRLALTVRYIVSQRLVNKIDSSRLLVTEIMGSSLRTREALLYGEGENRTFNDIIEAASNRGWHTFDQELLQAFDTNIITEDVAMIFASNKNKIRRDIEMLKKVKRPGEVANVSSGLKLQSSPLPQVAAVRQAETAATK
jgi:twitching motility protein PilT